MKTEMSTILNEWDLLAERFNTHKIKKDVHPDAAVNIYVGWPHLIQQINCQADYLGEKKLKILDFGCGAGEFLKLLASMGHKVMGTDGSYNMLKLAEYNLEKSIPLTHSSEFNTPEFIAKHKDYFDVVTSIHVLDWNENIEEIVEPIIKVLKKGGIFLFAVFPKSHICDSLVIKDLFEDFDCEIDPKAGYANFDGIRVPVYVREPSFYDNLFCKLNFEKVLEFYPPYPKEFLTKYNWKASLKPEMVILAYRKL